METDRFCRTTSENKQGLNLTTYRHQHVRFYMLFSDLTFD